MQTISVALCVYNGGLFLEGQLKSIAAQTTQPNELIICDDQSTDDSIIIINNFRRIAPFPVIFFVNETQLGSTKNFEKAIKLCSGDIIVLADQDDVWVPDKLLIIHNTFTETEETVMTFSDALVVDEELKPLGYSLWNVMKFTKHQQTLAMNGYLYKVLLKHNVITGATMAFRGSCKQFILPVDPLWVHDAWIAFILSTINKTALINIPLVMYRQHSSNQIGAKKLSFIKKIHRTQKRIVDRFYFLQHEMYNNAYLHLIQMGTDCSKMTALRSKVKHLQIRSKVFCNKTSIFSCFGDFFRLRYHRFSSGLPSFLEDLFSWLYYWYFAKR